GYTTPNVENDDIDSDVNGSQGTGTTQVMRINTGDRIASVDAGLILSVLPIEWIDFNAQFNGSYTELNWITGKEINNFEYVIERRHELEKNFVEIGKEAASTNQTASRHDYTYDDFDVVANGVYYYRIKQVDRDGSFTYSKVIAVKKVATKDFNVQLYPNPVRDILKVEIELGEEGILKVEVIDASGKQVMTQPFGGFTKSGKHIFELNISNLSTGNYIMKIQSPTGVVNQKFAVAK
ncbi:MAG: T9SS type A sorting domain-containing protein, partial [Saprospiraceae bacterium]